MDYRKYFADQEGKKKKIINRTICMSYFNQQSVMGVGLGGYGQTKKNQTKRKPKKKKQKTT